MPGVGPGAISILQATSGDENIDAGELGHAVPQNTPPKTPALQVEQVQGGKANTGLETNDDMMHKEQPVSPIKNQTASIKTSMVHSNLVRLGLREKTAAPVELIRKLAEDAINPAHISAGAQVPPDASDAGHGVPTQPSDVSSQASSMLGSNQAAIDYTKGRAKADPKSDVAQLLVQPPLSREFDPVLHKVLDHTSAAGVKLSHDVTKIAAARALLSNLVAKVAQEEEQKKTDKKEKNSGMGGSPSASSGFTASSLG
jgi:hypothetical protein